MSAAFYAFGVQPFGPGANEPTLYIFHGAPFGGNKIKLTKAARFFSYSTIVRADRLSLTPEAALKEYRAELMASIALRSAEVVRLQKRLNQLPGNPPPPKEEEP